MIKIKICGCKSENDILIVNKYLPDYIGFVFAESKRKIREEAVEHLKQLLSPQIQSVGVFVNAPLSQVIGLCEKGVIDLVQLHGEETKDYIKKLKEFIAVPVIKTIHVTLEEQQTQEQQTQEHQIQGIQIQKQQIQIEMIKKAQMLPCDYFLLDTYQKDMYGGSGVSFDWSLIPALNKPFFLAGGIKEGNIEKAIKETNAYCLDISSGVERSGIKDEELVKQILEYRNEI